MYISSFSSHTPQWNIENLQFGSNTTFCVLRNLLITRQRDKRAIEQRPSERDFVCIF